GLLILLQELVCSTRNAGRAIPRRQYASDSSCQRGHSGTCLREFTAHLANSREPLILRECFFAGHVAQEQDCLAYQPARAMFAILPNLGNAPGKIFHICLLLEELAPSFS